MSPGEVYRHDGKPVLHRSAVLYLDVLGITAAATGSARAETLVQLDHALKVAREAAMAQSDDDTQMLTWFSDNVFIAWPVHGAFDDEDALALALGAAAYLQLALALKGFLSRGGIAFGDVHMSEHFAFGPALIEAYKIEQRIRRPVIGLSEEAITAVRLAAAHHEPPAFGSELAIDADGTVFVDYLGFVLTEESDESSALALAVKHRDQASQALVGMAVGIEGRDKWEWTRAYHNAVCHRHAPRATNLILADAAMASIRPFTS